MKESGRLVEVSEQMREVDVLDLMMIEMVAKSSPTRRDVSEHFNISKDKARTRLEDLFERELIGKAEMCSVCEELLEECDCGSYSKTIHYFRNAGEEDAEFLEQFRKWVQELDKEEKEEMAIG